jgi:hypothetical protein
MKRTSGKSNLSIIRDYVNGERPFTQVSLMGSYELAEKKEGEEWVDLNGKRWKKVNGVKSPVQQKATIINEERCMFCNTDVRWGNRYDRQVWPKTRKCYDCFIEFETTLKSEGVYNNFIRHRDIINLQSTLIDFKSKLTETVEWCKSDNNKNLNFFNDDGTAEVEVWKDNTGILDKVKTDAENDLKLTNDRLTDIEKELLTLEVDMKTVKKVEKRFIKKYKKGRPDYYTGIRSINDVNK